MEEWTSVPIGSLLAFRMGTKQTTRRQGQEFCWSRKKRKGVLGREPTCQVSHRHAVGDEGTQVAEGSRDIRVEPGECPEGAYFVP